MKGRPALVLAILVYFTLDLSFAMMPGAFQFDPAESVETIQGNRARAATTEAPPVAPGGGILPLPVPAEIRDEQMPTRRVDRRRRFVMSWSARTSGDPAPPSEDPH